MLHLPSLLFYNLFYCYLYCIIFISEGEPRSFPLNVLFVCSFFCFFLTSWQEASFKEFAFTFEAFCVLICIDIFFLLSIYQAGWLGDMLPQSLFPFYFHSARSFPLFTLVALPGPSLTFCLFQDSFLFFFSCHKCITMSYISELHVSSEPCVVWTVYGNEWHANERRFLYVICWNCTEVMFLLLTPHTVDLIFIVEKGSEKTTPMTLRCKRIDRSYYRNI